MIVDESKEVNAVFTAWDVVATPQFDPIAGTYEGTQHVGISSSTAGAEIRYTTDGSIPSTDNGEVYSEPIEIQEDTVLKAIALNEGMTASEVSSGECIITYSLDVTTTPEQENYSYGDEVTLESVAIDVIRQRKWQPV